MVRDYWEFLSKENKARVIFGVTIAAAVLVLAIPYFITVLNNRQPNETAKVEEYTEIKTPEEEKKTDETQDQEKDERDQKEVVEEESLDTDSDESVATYAAPAANTTPTTPATANQPEPQASPAPTQTTVDDRSAGDDGYTPSGIDDPGTDAAMETDRVSDSDN